ncbi:sensor histidine kinase [Nannocystis punicea]|uniref:histidine kinase n=1 Tax=Nannocystis punicea TaxID=2995304 RepID=A0ABY7HFI3_9BACT|nr:AAA family ATPase [Nannocystis poenicansa]WAS98052.1 AAA family ATPase [Nannocystis poenicansa]
MAAGDYELAEQLHDGRTSQVFRGARRRDGATVILKALRREYSDPAGAARLQREAELLRRCAGAAVPEVLGLERWDGCPVLVLRDIGGRSLHRFRHGRALSLVARLDLALEICGALARVHAAGVVHRDLKPANIIVHGDGERVQLIDFAAAEAGEGTLQYMSPEQTGRTGRDVDPRSDYYALGVTLYELFTGRLPFASDDPLELLHAHLARVPAAPVALAPDLGDTLSSVVLRLLEKSPEARYQSLDGLRHDLARCRDAFARGEQPRFDPAARDRPPGLQLSATMFGRDRELAALLAVWTAVRAGARALALVSGPSGAGKSALVRALAGAVREAGGVFVSGRFEQGEKATPYAGLLAALDQLLRRALAEPDERLAAVRAALDAALGDGAAALGDVLPALALVTGVRPRPTVAAPAEAAARFHAAVTRLVRVFAGHAPLVIAVDDLQWADPASLRLYDELAREPSLDHLLLVGSYREDEVAAGHPLRGLAAVRVVLGPLAPADVQRLIGETLAWPEGQAAELAAVVAANTDNNPLFVRAYLRWLFDQGLLAWSAERDGWAWDAAATARATPGDDIVALMTRRLGALDPEVRAALQAAACIGARFDLARLADLLGRDLADLAAALGQAIDRGLVVPADAGVYEFVHDRVQQAAYAGLAAGERQRLHLELGRGLLRGASPAVLEDMLFEIVGHLNLGAARILAPAERLRLAALDLAAGRKAMGAAAFVTAVQLQRQGLAVLPEHAWSTHYALAFALTRDCMECEHFAGDPDAAAARFAPLLARARDDVDRAAVHDLKVALETDRANIHAALAAGRAGLALLGVHVPASASRLSILRELAAVRWLRGRAPLRALADLPPVRDPRIGSALRLLCTICVSAYHHQPDLSLLYGLRALALALRHGVIGESAIAVALYAFAHVHMFDDVAGARALVDVAYALADRFGDPRLGPQLANYCGVYVAAWLEPTAATVARLERELERATRLGSTSMALYISVGIIHARWLGLGDVDQLLASARAHASIGVGMPGFDQRHWHLLFVRLGLALRGETDGPTSLAGPDFDEDHLVEELGAHSRALASVYHLVKLTLLYHHGAIDQALALSRRLRWARAEGTLLLVDQITLALLVLTARGQPLARDAQRRARSWLGHLRRWAALGPDNLEGRLFLAEAELARCRGDHDQAALLYPRAVEAARRAGHLRIEALALERAGRHAAARQSHVLSHMYLGAAAERWDRWGAPALAARLRAEFPGLAAPAPVPAAAPLPGPPSAGAEAIDVAALLRSTRAITGELVLDKLLRALVRTVLEVAGARRCFVLLGGGGGLQIAAAADVARERLDVLQSRAMSEEPDLPQSVVHFVARTRRDVVLGDAAVDHDFAGDPALAGVRSVLCAPILGHGELLGVLYLDNDLAPHTFGSGRLALLRHLAAQIATSIDNARLYEDLARARDAAVRADRLKTRFLLNMSHELRTPLNAVLGYAELIRESAAEGDLAAIDGDTEKIRRAAARLVRTLTNILELSRVEADVVQPARVAVDVAALVREAVAACDGEARARGDALELELDPAAFVCLTDPAMLAHCVHTLVDNAVRFTDRGRVTVRLAAIGGRDVPWLELRITDTGVGIAAADLPRLFLAFQPLDDAPTRAQEGSGVSLALAHRFARLLGGVIDVASVPGSGSTFVLRLPAPRE